MPQTAAQRREYRRRARELGLCIANAGHGRAVTQSLCQPCADRQNAGTRRAYYRRKARGVCRASATHGPATDGLWCEACGVLQRERHRLRWIEKKRSRPVCIFGAAHGPAIDGKYCAKCVARRAAAGARVEKRGEAAREARTQARIAAIKKANEAKKPRKETIKERIERCGTIDTSNLWELFWRRC